MIAHLFRFRICLHWRVRHIGQRRWEVFRGGESIGRFRSAESAFGIADQIGDRVRDHKLHHPLSACWKWS